MKKPLAQRFWEFLFGQQPEPEPPEEYDAAESREYAEIVEEIRKETAPAEPEILLTAKHKVVKPKKKAKKPVKKVVVKKPVKKPARRK